MHLIFLRFLNWFLGYIIIDISDGFTERFINLLSGIGVSTWGIVNINKSKIRLRMRARQFRKIKKIAFKTKVRVRIIKKRGLPFILFRYRKRYGLIAGAVLFLALLIVPAFFVWKIEVIGEETVTESAIMECVSKDGIRIGMPNLSVNKKEAQLRLLKEFENIIWTSIKVKGSRLFIEIKEGVPPPRIITQEEVCNIVAKKDGLITSINVMEGTKMVKKGDTVKKGDLIVSGVVDTKSEGLRYVHSLAEVKADTVTVITTKMPLEFSEFVPSGRQYKRFYLQFLNYSVKLYIRDRIKYKNFDLTEYENSLSLGKSFYFPVGVKTEAIRETYLKNTKISEEAAKASAMALLSEREKLTFQNMEIKDRQVTVEIINNEAVAKGIYICSEEIGEKSIIE